MSGEQICLRVDVPVDTTFFHAGLLEAFVAVPAAPLRRVDAIGQTIEKFRLRVPVDLCVIWYFHLLLELYGHFDILAALHSIERIVTCLDVVIVPASIFSVIVVIFTIFSVAILATLRRLSNHWLQFITNIHLFIVEVLIVTIAAVICLIIFLEVCIRLFGLFRLRWRYLGQLQLLKSELKLRLVDELGGLVVDWLLQQLWLLDGMWLLERHHDEGFLVDRVWLTDAALVGVVLVDFVVWQVLPLVHDRFYLGQINGGELVALMDHFGFRGLNFARVVLLDQAQDP